MCGWVVIGRRPPQRGVRHGRLEAAILGSIINTHTPHHTDPLTPRRSIDLDIQPHNNNTTTGYGWFIMRRLILPLLLVLLTAATPATPAADSAPKRFAVHPPPLSRALFPALEAARLHALRLLLRGRSLHIDTSAGVAVHVLVFKGPPDRKKQGGRGGAGGEEEEALLPPLVLLHGVCSTAHDYAPLVRRLRGRCQWCVRGGHHK